MRISRIVLPLILLFAFSLINTGCAVGYVLKQGYYQAKLLYGSEPIEKALIKFALSAQQKKKLQLIVDMRNFSQTKLALDPGTNYTKINVKWDQNIYNVSASKRLAFEPYVWWFPIVGTVPYKGFFDKADAVAEINRLKELQYDVMSYAVGGYSTLGYFSDPVWPKMLEKSENSLAELIIHELAHSTVYYSSQSDFNESFANFVGRQGTLAYLTEKYGALSAEYLHAKNMQEDEDRYMKFMWELFQKLDSVYQSAISDEKKLEQKQNIIKNAPVEYGKVAFATEEYRRYFPSDINNASLMSFKRYNSGQPEFHELFNLCKSNWVTFIGEMKKLKNSSDALGALQLRIKELSVATVQE